MYKYLNYKELFHYQRAFIMIKYLLVNARIHCVKYIKFCNKKDYIFFLYREFQQNKVFNFHCIIFLTCSIVISDLYCQSYAI